MKQKSKYGTSIILSLLVLLAGCNLIPGLGQQKTQVANILGNDGLTITIGKTPATLFTGQGLAIPITLENVGATDVTGAILAITGYNPTYVQFNTFPRVEGINLKGRSAVVAQGERDTEIFKINPISLPDVQETMQTFEVVACYPYKTQASPVVCINPTLATGEQQVKVGCDYVDAKISSTQGAPIAVTKVETWYYLDRNQVEFRIFAKDVSGTGVVMSSSAYPKRCTSTEPLSEEDIGTINLDAYMSGEKLACYTPDDQTQSETFKLTSNAAIPVAICRASINPQDQPYTTPLSVDMTYGYVALKVFSIDLKSTVATGS